MLTLSLFAVIILVSTMFGARFHSLRLGFGLTAAVALVVAIILQVIDIPLIVDALAGDAYVQPWKIIAIFFSLAYLALSLDSTGVIEHISYQVIRLAKTKFTLFVLLYFFAGILTIFTDNDIVILTLTPLTIYLAKYVRINPLPFLFTIFISANTFGIAIYTGNPTNIIIGNALGISFIDFTLWMIMPALFAIATSFALLTLLFRQHLSGTLRTKQKMPHAIRNRADAIISTILMLLTLFTFILSDWLPIDIWGIALLFLGIALIKDILISIIDTPRYSMQTLRQMPWNVLPFVVFFFIFTYVLASTSIFHSLSHTLSQASAQWLPVILSAATTLLANIINNQPTTIFMTTLLADSSILESAHATPASLAVAIASNIGAILTPIGTLAGMMWLSILKQHDIKMTYGSFLKITLLIIPITLCMALIGLQISTFILSP